MSYVLKKTNKKLSKPQSIVCPKKYVTLISYKIEQYLYFYNICDEIGNKMTK